MSDICLSGRAEASDDAGRQGFHRRDMLRLLGVGASAVALGAVASPAWAATPRAATLRSNGLPRLSGMPWASGCIADYAAFGAARGRPVDMIGAFPQKTSWDAIRKMGGLGWLVDKRGVARPESIVLSYPLFPTNDSPKTKGPAMWQAAARGDFDWHHDAAAATLTRYPQQFVLRLGWEWNIPSFPWACSELAVAPSYIAYFRRVVDRFRARVPGIKIDWCSAKAGRVEGNVGNYYPGSDWVDFVGHDRYDWYPRSMTQADWDKEFLKTVRGGPKGPGAWLAFARSLGKPLSLGEWGVVGGVEAGGGDNPLFINNMLSFLSANAADIGYECYFNINHLPNIHALAANPQSAAAYRTFLAQLA